MMFIDKQRARHHAWRIRETTLFLTALLGGSLGILAGMYLFRHKTKHRSFVFGIPFILLLQLLLGVFFWRTTVKTEGSPAYALSLELDQVKESGDTLPASFTSYFKPFSYKILSSSVRGSTGYVTVSFTTPDAQGIARDICLILAAERVANAEAFPDYPTQEDIFSLLEKQLSERTYKEVTTQSTISMTKTDTSWQIADEEAYLNAITGGLISYINDPYLLTPDQILRLYLDYYESQSAAQWDVLLHASDYFPASNGSDNPAQSYLSALTDLFSCHITRSRKLSDSETDITVSVKTLDMPLIMNAYKEKLIAYAKDVDSITAGADMLDQTSTALLSECLKEDVPAATFETTIRMKHNGNGWYPEITDEVTDVFMGHLKEALETLKKTDTE